MEMEMEAAAETFTVENPAVESLIERLAAAAGVLETAAQRLTSFEIEASASREAELAHRLAEAEKVIATLRTSANGGRKTSVANALAAKDGLTLEANALDTALGSMAGLSIEQRIAVKAQLLRSGLLG